MQENFKKINELLYRINPKDRFLYFLSIVRSLNEEGADTWELKRLISSLTDDNLLMAIDGLNNNPLLSQYNAPLPYEDMDQLMILITSILLDISTSTRNNISIFKNIFNMNNLIASIERYYQTMERLNKKPDWTLENAFYLLRDDLELLCKEEVENIIMTQSYTLYDDAVSGLERDHVYWALLDMVDNVIKLNADIIRNASFFYVNKGLALSEDLYIAEICNIFEMALVDSIKNIDYVYSQNFYAVLGEIFKVFENYNETDNTVPWYQDLVEGVLKDGSL